MTPTPTDPAAIDLVEIAILASTCGLSPTDIDNLIAAVEVLRDEVGGLNIDLVNAGSDNEELRERVADLKVNSAFLGDMRKAQRQLVEALEDKKAAEAQLGALTTAMAQSSQHTEAREAGLVAALTPSIMTKAAYMGEFSYPAEQIDDDGEAHPVTYCVPWTTIKEIMAAILAAARKSTVAPAEAEEG